MPALRLGRGARSGWIIQPGVPTQRRGVRACVQVRNPQAGEQSREGRPAWPGQHRREEGGGGQNKLPSTPPALEEREERLKKPVVGGAPDAWPKGQGQPRWCRPAGGKSGMPPGMQTRALRPPRTTDPKGRWWEVRGGPDPSVLSVPPTVPRSVVRETGVDGHSGAGADAWE